MGSLSQHLQPSNLHVLGVQPWGMVWDHLEPHPVTPILSRQTKRNAISEKLVSYTSLVK